MTNVVPLSDGESLLNDDADRIAQLVWDVGAHLRVLSEVALGEASLSPALFGVLGNVERHPGISITELARRSLRSHQAVSQLVARLVKLGFLERRLSEQGFGVALFVTAAGKQAQRDAATNMASFASDLTSALGKRNHDELVRLLKHARPILADLAAERRDQSGDSG